MGDNKPDRPVFCGNFEYDAHERDIEKLFRKYGDVERVDMKTGFAFVYMYDKRDGDDAIRKLDGMSYGYKRRRLRVEWANHVESTTKREVKPNTTLFVVNFDVRRVRERDLEKHFSKYGRLTRTEIKKNYAFVQFDNLDDAIDALKNTHNSDFMGRNVTVEYVANEDPHAKRDDRHRSPVRTRSRSPRNRSRSPSYAGRKRSRSASPHRRSISPARSASPRRRVSRSKTRSRSRSPYRSPSRSPPRRRYTRSPSPGR